MSPRRLLLPLLALLALGACYDPQLAGCPAGTIPDGLHCRAIPDLDAGRDASAEGG